MAMRSVGATGGVVAVAWLLYSESPPLLYARTRYQYFVSAKTLKSLKFVVFAPTVAIWFHVPGTPLLSGARSIFVPSSLFALSVHDKLIWLLDTTVATRFVGA